MKPIEIYESQDKSIRTLSISAIYCFSITALLFTISEALGLNSSFFIIGLASVVSYVLFYCMFNVKHFFTACVFLSVAFIVIILIYFNPIILLFIERLSALLKNMILFVEGKEAIAVQNTVLLWQLLFLFISPLTYICIVHTKKIVMLTIAYTITFVVYWYQNYNATLFMLMIFLICMLYMFGMERVKTRQIKIALVYSVAIVIGAFLMPKVPFIIKTDTVVSSIIETFPSLQTFQKYFNSRRVGGKPVLFDFAESGFEPNSPLLGGRVKKNNSLVMTVISPIDLYLRGNCKTLYQNNSWTQDSLLLSLLETDSLYEESVDQNELTSIIVSSVNSSMRTIFAPYKTCKVSSLRYKKFTMDENDLMYFPDAVYRGESYTIYSLLSKNDIKKIKVNINPAAKKQYLELPKTLPSRVYDLGVTITVNAKSKKEEADLIKKYLLSNYTYSLEPNNTPEENDFVDYFLFDQKKGYCTYYASAMAILLRTRGIPSRYIEGYVAHEKRSDGLYQIRQSDAHAWVEAYFEDEGWLLFEATPGFEGPEDYSRKVETLDTAVYEEEVLENSLIEENKKQNLVPFITTQDPVNLSKKPKVDAVKYLLDLGLFLLKICLLIFVTLCIPLRLYFVQRNKNKNLIEFHSLKIRERYIILYKALLDLLKRRGKGIKSGETVAEYSNRLAITLYTDSTTFITLSDTFINAEYANELINEKELIVLLEYYKKNFNYLQRTNGCLKMFFLQYLVGVKEFEYLSLKNSK